MCGRFNLRTSPADLAQMFLPGVSSNSIEVESVQGSEQAPSAMNDLLAPRYNIAPTQPICCVLSADAQGPRHLRFLRWGLIPGWAKELSIGNRMINARGETVREKPAFRRAFAVRRCLIPASGYYEWQKQADGKQPYLLHRPDHQLFALAGLWETNQRASEDGATIGSCTILTIAANQRHRAIHDRMPLVLSADAYHAWLDPQTDLDQIEQYVKPPPDDFLDADPVSHWVNNPQNDGPQCIEPLA